MKKYKKESIISRLQFTWAIKFGLSTHWMSSIYEHDSHERTIPDVNLLSTYYIFNLHLFLNVM